MVALLLQAGISVEKERSKDGQITILIDGDRFSDAVELMKSNGYPKATYSDLGSVFKQDGLISSPTEEWARFLYARSQELSQTISELEGVLSARVHIAGSKQDNLLGKSLPPSASVSVRYFSDAPIDALIPEIKQLVAFGVENLSFDQVSVILTPIEPSATNQKDPFVDVGGIITHHASVWRLHLLIYTCLALALLLPLSTGLAYYLARRKPRS